jgi:hypothetical protein
MDIKRKLQINDLMLDINWTWMSNDEETNYQTSLKPISLFILDILLMSSFLESWTNFGFAEPGKRVAI